MVKNQNLDDNNQSLEQMNVDKLEKLKMKVCRVQEYI